jgi:PAS domain S-box-containing protein
MAETPSVLLVASCGAGAVDGFDDEWVVHAVDSVGEAVEVAGSVGVDCVVSAQRLPDGHGLELYRELADDLDVPFVLWPAECDAALASRAVAAGVDAYVPRGDAGEPLSRAVRRALADGGPGIERDGGAEVAAGGGPGDAGGERAAEPWRAVVETLDDVVWIVDERGEVTYVNEDETVYGIPTDEVLGRSIVDVVQGLEFADPARGPEFVADLRALLDGDGDRLHRRLTLTSPDGDVGLDVQVVPLGGADGHAGAVGVNRDVTALLEHERQLTALHETATELLEAESRAEIARLVVDAADEILDLPGVTVYLYDPAENALSAAAYTGDKDRLYDHLPPVKPGEGITGVTFLEGETAVYDDVHESEHMLNDDAAIASGLFIPLDEHGVFIAGDIEVGAFDEADVERAELLAATAEAALDRAQRDDVLRAQDRTLEEQNRQLERLNEVNERIRRVQQVVVRADSRAEIEQAVCEELVAADRFGFAWLGRSEDGELRPRARAGDDGGYLDRVSVPVAADEATEPAGRAAATGEPVTVGNVAADPRDRAWRSAALRADFRSVAAIPLRYAQVDYGVLALYADTTDAFDDLTATVLAELGDTVAYAINAVERRSALLSDQQFECEFTVSGATTALTRVAAALYAEVEVRSVTPRSDGRYNVYASVRDGAAADVDALPDELNVVAAAEVVDEGPPARVRLVVDDAGMWESLPDLAGRPETVVVDPDETARVTVTLPAATDLSEFASRLESYYRDVTLVARRQHALTDRETMREEAGLTDRQHEVLEAAYHSGFFEWPRYSTGEEIASALDISQPAFLDHLRASERKLVATFLDPHADD